MNTVPSTDVSTQVPQGDSNVNNAILVPLTGTVSAFAKAKKDATTGVVIREAVEAFTFTPTVSFDGASEKYSELTNALLVQACKDLVQKTPLISEVGVDEYKDTFISLFNGITLDAIHGHVCVKATRSVYGQAQFATFIGDVLIPSIVVVLQSVGKDSTSLVNTLTALAKQGAKMSAPAKDKIANLITTHCPSAGGSSEAINWLTGKVAEVDLGALDI